MRRIKKETLQSILLVSPSILAIAIFVYGFIGWTVRVSLSQWKGLLPDYTFVGLKNYTGLFSDARFMVDIRNTVVFTSIFVAGALLF
ncbi:MAG: sugar ABC transporter permease, partial [Planctomycetaceae bacterium]